jgi:hypothetical protein
MISMRGLVIGTCVLAIAPVGERVARAEPPQVAGVEASDALYRQWYELRKRDPVAALPIARRYLEAYPTADVSDFLRKWVTDTRARTYAQARKRHDIDSMIALTRDAASENGFRALDFMTFTAFEIRERELFHSPPVYTHADVAVELAQKAIDAIESGGVPPSAATPHWNRDSTLALLQQTVAMAEEHKGDEPAATRAYRRAVELEPGNPLNHFALSRLYQDDFRRAFDRWRYLEDGASSAAATTEARREAERWADRLLKEWTEFLSHSGNRADLREHRAQVLGNLEQVYRFRHPGEEDGLRHLLAKYR